MPRNVAIVFASDYSGQLEKVAFHTPVWLADTPANHEAAERAWHSAVEWPHISVTLFRPPAGEPSRDDWQTLLAEISIRERNADALEIVGAPLSPIARATLVDAGFTRFEETASGFKARKW
jgi:hypothetical protein